MILLSLQSLRPYKVGGGTEDFVHQPLRLHTALPEDPNLVLESMLNVRPPVSPTPGYLTPFSDFLEYQHSCMYPHRHTQLKVKSRLVFCLFVCFRVYKITSTPFASGKLKFRELFSKVKNVKTASTEHSQTLHREDKTSKCSKLNRIYPSNKSLPSGFWESCRRGDRKNIKARGVGGDQRNKAL